MGSLTEEERVEETLQEVPESDGPQREHTRCDDRISIFYTPIDEADEEFESRADSNFDGINTGSEENPQLFKLQVADILHAIFHFAALAHHRPYALPRRPDP